MYQLTTAFNVNIWACVLEARYGGTKKQKKEKKTMQMAIITRSERADYNTFATASFEAEAETLWKKLHNEIYPGNYFGVEQKNGQLSLVIKIKSDRKDIAGRNINDFLIVKANEEVEKNLIVNLAVKFLMCGEDSVRAAIDEAAQAAINSAPLYMVFPFEWEHFSSVYSYSSTKWTSLADTAENRHNLATALPRLAGLQKDFVIGVVPYPTEKVMKAFPEQSSGIIISAREDSIRCFEQPKKKQANGLWSRFCSLFTRKSK